MSDFRARIRGLLRFDGTRATHLAEDLQYSMVYALPCLLLGSLIDAAVHPLYPEEELNSWWLFWRAVGVLMMQTLLMVFCVFYIRKAAALVPTLVDLTGGRYVPHLNSAEFLGGLTMAVFFVGAQTSMQEQTRRVRHFLFPGQRRMQS